jgi:copper chaperone CopZ
MTKQPGAQHEIQTTTLRVTGMSCGACVRHVTKAVDGLTGVVHVRVDLNRGELVVEHLPAHVDITALVTAVRDAGYAARVERVESDSENPSHDKPAHSGCSCGCSEPRLSSAQWANLGTSTIG